MYIYIYIVLYSWLPAHVLGTHLIVYGSKLKALAAHQEAGGVADALQGPVLDQPRTGSNTSH